LDPHRDVEKFEVEHGETIAEGCGLARQVRIAARGGI
jgi:hypothetical protein